MSTNPLSYPSLKVVLQYMDANARFQLSHRVPAIRTTEKSTTLRIESIAFFGTNIKINDTNYNIGIYRKCHATPVPRRFQKMNDDGGFVGDLDKYGTPDNTSVNVALPGDVAIDTSDWMDESEDISHTILSIEQRIDELVEKIRGFDGEQNEAMRLNEELEYQKFQLQCYIAKRDEQPPPLDLYLQLIISSPRGEYIERMEYTKKYHQASKYLNSILFAGRRFSIQLKTLDLGPCGKILRLPLGLKFRICELKCRDDVEPIYEALKPIIEESSYPLEHLAMSFEEYNFVHPIVKSAKKLTIRCVIYNIMDNGLLLNLENQQIYLPMCYFQSSSDDFIKLIQKWKDVGRDVGTRYSIGIWKEEYIDESLFGDIEEEFGGVMDGDRSLTIPMTATKEIKVFYKLNDSVGVANDISQWKLTMEIVEKRN